ncbi:MAG: hypothetical protein GOV00_03315 [Candidatus Altiarchaeota archaeon]|nr:hypothetical protein [Candidatus Altiarchaeota archaeon]
MSNDVTTTSNECDYAEMDLFTQWNFLNATEQYLDGLDGEIGQPKETYFPIIDKVIAGALINEKEGRDVRDAAYILSGPGDISADMFCNLIEASKNEKLLLKQRVGMYEQLNELSDGKYTSPSE